MIHQEKILEIMNVRPTVADLEAASLWLAGDADIYGPEEPLKGVPSDIIRILTEEEQGEP